MSEITGKYLSYGSLRQQRMILTALVLGLVAVFIAILLEIYYRGARATQIDARVRQLAEPLNPVLNIKVLSQLDTYEQLSLAEIRQRFANEPPSVALLRSQAEREASSSAQVDIVTQTIEENTLSEEEVLSQEEIENFLESSETGSGTENEAGTGTEPESGNTTIPPENSGGTSAEP